MIEIKGIPIDQRSRYTRMAGNLSEIKNHLDINQIPYEEVELINENTIIIETKPSLENWWVNRMQDKELTSAFWLLNRVNTYITARLW